MNQNKSTFSKAQSDPPSEMASTGVEMSLLSADVYQALYEFVREGSGRTDICDAGPEELDRLARFLMLEARLLDERNYEHWLECLTEDCVYWVPSGPAADPRTEVGVNLDDRRRLLDRIALHDTGVQVAQIPPSSTCRVVTNIEAWRERQGFRLRSNLVVWEFRRGRTSRYAGRQDHLIVRRGNDLRIRFKIVSLIDQTEPQGNITFIL